MHAVAFSPAGRTAYVFLSNHLKRKQNLGHVFLALLRILKGDAMELAEFYQCFMHWQFQVTRSVPTRLSLTNSPQSRLDVSLIDLSHSKLIRESSSVYAVAISPAGRTA